MLEMWRCARRDSRRPNTSNFFLNGVPTREVMQGAAGRIYVVVQLKKRGVATKLDVTRRKFISISPSSPYLLFHTSVGSHDNVTICAESADESGTSAPPAHKAQVT